MELVLVRAIDIHTWMLLTRQEFSFSAITAWWSSRCGCTWRIWIDTVCGSAATMAACIQVLTPFMWKTNKLFDISVLLPAPTLRMTTGSEASWNVWERFWNTLYMYITGSNIRVGSPGNFEAELRLPGRIEAPSSIYRGRILPSYLTNVIDTSQFTETDIDLPEAEFKDPRQFTEAEFWLMLHTDYTLFFQIWISIPLCNWFSFIERQFLFVYKLAILKTIPKKFISKWFVD